MPGAERQQVVLDLLKGLRGLDPLKQLFWTELNYQRVNQPLSRRGWTETAADALADDPLLFAAGGEDSQFQVIYARLNSEKLLLGLERPVVMTLLREHPYALFVVSNSARQRWHFINVRDDKDMEKRRLFRRITVGEDERLRTAAERLEMLDLSALTDLSPLGIQQRHDEAFNVEAVQKVFFKAFADVYDKVAADISNVPEVKEEAGRLAQLLLDRMLFLYFIQKKGWLDQKGNYLYSRFTVCLQKDPKGSSYYHSVLLPLFRCLSNSNAGTDGVGDVPFLNGGLFEESAKQSSTELLRLARVHVKNSTFKAIFDDVLEKFNFTVTEDTPLDMEVAIDPEMLGKIFESLILQLEKDPDKDLRKLTGSYYTPRPIVHFMCQEALKEYLVGELAGDDENEAAAVRVRIGELFALPPAGHLDDNQFGRLEKLFTPAEARSLRHSVLNCRVCDPAVGSGAFPVGMLHEMVAAVGRLDVRLHGPEVLRRRNFDYDLKKRVIESCLYGVDIQEQAVRLCELRLWLSLVVNYEIDPAMPFSQAIRDVPSLPNLSYRIVRGDSLLERLFGHVVQLDEMAKDAKTKQLIDSIQADKQAYFREGRTEEKRRLELKILAKQADLAERLIQAKRAAMATYQKNFFGDDDMTAKERHAKAQREAQLAELSELGGKVARAREAIERIARQSKTVNRGDLDTLRRQFFQSGDAPTFIWRVDFAEVFREKRGFDIAIANPPYVRADQGAKHLAMRREILKSNCYETLWEKWDLYVPFIERSYKLLCADGVLQFITSDAYCHAKYSERSREWFLRNALVRRIDFVSDLRIFEAGVRNVLFCYRRSEGGTNIPLRFLHQGEFGAANQLASSVQVEATPRVFQADAQKATGGPLVNCVSLSEICYISYGLRANSDDRHYKGEFVTDDLVQNSPDPVHRAFVEGKDLGRWLNHSVKYLEYGTKRAPARFSRPTFPELHFTAPKLIAMRSPGATPRTILDSIGLIFDASEVGFVPWHLLKGICNRSIAKTAAYDSQHGMRGCREDYEARSRQFDVKYVLAVMNSSRAREFLRANRRSNIHLYPDDWKPLPIPFADARTQKMIVATTDEILCRLKAGKNIDELERELDKKVSSLYGRA